MEKDLEKLIAKKNPHEGHRARMRCKFDRDPEMETIEDHEALEFHLSLIIPRKDTNELAHELIAKFGSLDAVMSASPAELVKVKNMTVSASYMLASEFAMVRKAMRAGSVTSRNKRLHRPEECISYMHSYFIGRKTECFCIGVLQDGEALLPTDDGHLGQLPAGGVRRRPGFQRGRHKSGEVHRSAGPFSA